jgi:hypothetical protein
MQRLNIFPLRIAIKRARIISNCNLNLNIMVELVPTPTAEFTVAKIFSKLSGQSSGKIGKKSVTSEILKINLSGKKKFTVITV